MTGRHTGVVCHLDEATGYGEIAVVGMQPVSVDFAALRRCGADKLGAVIDFEHGVLAGGTSGAVNLTARGNSDVLSP
jgi:hypothetical protein